MLQRRGYGGATGYALRPNQMKGILRGSVIALTRSEAVP